MTLQDYMVNRRILASLCQLCQNNMPIVRRPNRNFASCMRNLKLRKEQLHFRKTVEKCPPKPEPTTTQMPIQPCLVQPFCYDQGWSTWQGLNDSNPGLSRGSILTILSWNLDWSSPDPGARTAAALNHLEQVLGTNAKNTITMLQEISPPSLHTILDNPWVQQNFVLSDVKPPESSRTVTLNKSSIVERSKKQVAEYFTIMMVSKSLPILGCFRIPLITRMGRDVLSFDLRISGNKRTSGGQECIRLCTTHLESLWEGKTHRLGQLVTISNLLKGPAILGHSVVAGIVGGDMNALEKLEHDYHRTEEVGLNDIWEDDLQPPMPELGSSPSQEGKSYNMEKASTWGSQSPRCRDVKRLDKIFYSGSIKTLAVRDSQNAIGRISRLGVGLTTKVKAWELERDEIEFVKGQPVTKTRKEFVSEKRFSTLKNLGFLQSYRVRDTIIDCWVSDHFGITARIEII